MSTRHRVAVGHERREAVLKDLKLCVQGFF